MKKITDFDVRWEQGWPETDWLEPFFLAPKGKEWSYKGGNDSWGLSAEGADGTAHLGEDEGRIDLTLDMYGNPEHGVLLIYQKWGDGNPTSCASKGDLTRLKEWVKTLHGDQMPIGLYIPFAEAWKAVKEFIETDGQLPESIEWVNTIDLPEGTFPES